MARAIQPGGGIRPYHTTVTDHNGVVLCTLYNTMIFIYDRNRQKITLNTGGHNTATTRRRMNECLAHYGFTFRVNVRTFDEGPIYELHVSVPGGRSTV